MNQHPALANENRPFNPEFMTNYELGFRRHFENGVDHFWVQKDLPPDLEQRFCTKEFKPVYRYFTQRITSKKLILFNVLNMGKVDADRLVKLFSNAYRYIHFSISNQFFMICKNLDLDFVRIRNIMRDGYKRNLNLQYSGFTAGPCLLKDTMQLSAFYKNLNERIDVLFCLFCNWYKNFYRLLDKTKSLSVLR